MKDSTYQHMCTILVGVASLFRYTGYDMATFIVTSLTHSAHLRNPSAIIDNAGYYGQAVKEMSSCLSFFIVPIILNYIKPKWALVVGSGLFAFYIATFFYINTYLYFSANVLLGVAFTLIYTAFSTYQLQFSTRKTLARNSATAYGIAGFSLLFGGALYIYVTTAHSETAHEAVAVGTQQYRYYSEAETRTMCGFLFACCLISLLIHALLPNKEIPNSLASESPHEKLTLTKQVGVTASVLTNSYILMFIPRFLNYGLFMSFYMNIYPTSLQFSTILASRHPMLTAYYAIAMCAGIAIGGLIIARLNHSFHDFGLRPLYYITMALQLVTYGIAVLTVPNRSTAQPTDDSALTESHLIWVLMVAFLLGFTDSAQNASNTVLCSRLIPGRAAHTYAAARFFVGIAASLIFFCSPLLTMTMHAIILTSTTVVSGLSFNLGVIQVEKREEAERTKNNLDLPELKY
ncbi:hypothetical protein PFISCL1PPCAC_11663 [Pristionchus fissidentatus]|uniref:Membrane transporter n=1 Tax=Pristionchus fissidentatus TaxID=1538716 RepID=A0AAV5VLS0_9BILA|nr:hypothetical protein PFISCL1PPCAC_11663 [Pristionchus fissidentatus]